MNEYAVTVDTGVCGHDFTKVIEADNKKEAEAAALEDVAADLQYMLTHLKVIKVAE